MGSRLNWLFLFIAAALVWQSNPPLILGEGANVIGLDTTTTFYKFLEGAFVPIFFTLAAFTINLFYNYVIFRMHRNFLGGYWVYSLIAIDNEVRVNVVGVFKVDHTPNNCSARGGLAFIRDNDDLKQRGDWNSKWIYYDGRRLEFNFTMRTFPMYQGEGSKIYSGRIAADRMDLGGIFNGKPFRGEFQDFEDRSHIHGPVYLEKLNTDDSNVKRALSILETNGKLLVRRALTLIGE